MALLREHTMIVLIQEDILDFEAILTCERCSQFILLISDAKTDYQKCVSRRFEVAAFADQISVIDASSHPSQEIMSRSLPFSHILAIQKTLR
jgi:hypothetical protein